MKSFESNDHEFYEIINQITKESSVDNSLKNELLISEKSVQTSASTVSLLKENSVENQEKVDDLFNLSLSPSQNKELLSKTDAKIQRSISEGATKAEASKETIKINSEPTISLPKDNSNSSDNTNSMFVSRTHLEDVNKEIHENSIAEFFDPRLPNNSPEIDYVKDGTDKDQCQMSDVSHILCFQFDVKSCLKY